MLCFPFRDGGKPILDGQSVLRCTVQPGRQTEAMTLRARDCGVSWLTPVFGQYGDYASWFDDGVHDSYYYTLEDFALLGVSNIHLGDSDSEGEARISEELFRARVSAEALDALVVEMNAPTRRIEASMPFNVNQIWGARP